MTDKPDDGSQGTDTVMTETPKPRERTPLPQIKKIQLSRPPIADERSPPQQPHEAKQNVHEPQVMKPKEDQLQVKESAEQLPVPIQSPKPQQTRKSSEPQSVTRQRSSAQPATRQGAEPQPATRQRSSAQPATRQRSEPQQTRQRTSAQPANRQRSDRQPAESHSTTRRRGRLTARQQLAVSKSGEES